MSSRRVLGGHGQRIEPANGGLRAFSLVRDRQRGACGRCPDRRAHRQRALCYEEGGLALAGHRMANRPLGGGE